jgi:putative zinc finger/helix-turn-helix YgiT family protein
MLEYCLNCDYAEEIPLTRESIRISVCGEEIEATKEVYRCPACGEGFISSLGHDALTEAYRKYRHRHGLLQPEEIRQWREQTGLTQPELSAFLGWESSTLRWYENGDLQEVEHDNLLKSLMQQPLNLLQLIENQPQQI